MVAEVLKNMESDELWNDLCSRLFEALPSYGEFEDRVRKNTVARLVGLLPFIGRTERPYRDALTNMSIFMISSYGPGKDIYTHIPADDADVLSRLTPIMNFTGGRKKILDRGMNLIAMVLVNDYRKDQEEDRRTGHYNPLNAGVWDYVSIMEELKEKVNAVPCRKMDEILNSEFIPFAYWND